MKLIPLVILLAVQAQAVVWDARLPDGTIAVASLTSWGASVSYNDYPSVESTSISGRTTLTTTTRTADAPLTLSLMAEENWDWVTAFDNHWISFSALGLDGVTREADFYPVEHLGPRTQAMYSAAGGSHVAVPEPSAWAWAVLPLTLFAFLKRKN